MQGRARTASPIHSRRPALAGGATVLMGAFLVEACLFAQRDVTVPRRGRKSGSSRSGRTDKLPRPGRPKLESGGAKSTAEPGNPDARRKVVRGDQGGGYVQRFADGDGDPPGPRRGAARRLQPAPRRRGVRERNEDGRPDLARHVHERDRLRTGGDVLPWHRDRVPRAELPFQGAGASRGYAAHYLEDRAADRETETEGRHRDDASG